MSLRKNFQFTFVKSFYSFSVISEIKPLLLSSSFKKIKSYDLKMNICIYKNKVFNTKDVIDVSINQKDLKVELSSFKDDFYKIKKECININELKEIDESCTNTKGLNEKEKDEINVLKYDVDELRCLYFFFLVHLLRFKNNLDLNLIKNICSEINNVISSNVSYKNNCLHSVNLKNFFINILKNSGKVEYNLKDFYSSISIVIEKCSILFLNTYKTISLCKYLTCCLCNIFELFNLNCDVLFKNSFNNNVNNSNIYSINSLIANIKWMIHDSKIDKNNELSKNFSSNMLLFIYTQSKLVDECEYFINLINQNFKNCIDNCKNEYYEEMNSLNLYIDVLCKNINENINAHIGNILDIANKILPLYINKLKDFHLSNEVIINENTDLKKPPSNGFIFDLEIKDNSEFPLLGVYKNYLRNIQNMINEVARKNELQKIKEMNIAFNNLLIFLTDIIIHMNIIYDIKAYNKAVSQIMKNKKVSSSIHNIGIGCLDFKNFLYSLISNNNSKLKLENEIMKDNKIITNRFFNFLNDHFSPYKFEEVINELLMPKNINFNLKVPKGTKDFTGEDMQLRNIFFDFIKKKFLIHGAVEIDTPVFELKETLTDKYGEDSKLIFDLKDQGGENLSLRYDLTVPLYRFVNTNDINQLKRFHIGKVYRRDEPSMNRGRFREFYQCDFDIVGKYDKLRTDFHILYIFWDILSNLKNVIGNFNCKLNHRKVLEYMLVSSNIPKDKVKTISSSIDKLDKITFHQFREELLNEKGIPVESVDKIEEYISKTLSLSPFLVIEFLRNDLNQSEIDETYKNEVHEVINHLEQIFELLKHFNMVNQFTFDLTLARGLDYYTGIIFEFVLLSETNVGSIAAGGRYDYLIRNKRKEYIPSVGASIGIERIITIAEQFIKNKGLFLTGNEYKNELVDKEINNSNVSKLNLKDNSIEVLVCNIKKNCFKETIELCKKLWEQDISTEFIYVNDQRIQKQLVYALEKQIPLVVIIGDEIEKGIVKLRELTLDKNKSVGEKEINIDNCINEIKNYFACNLSWKQNITNILFEKKTK
ncbi:histidine--tRNA ligase, putative [Plasmodium gallinaceum]|uniref:histidine--tRNA ligase n=1 Tax=Plasmodium gallinaceum TaxID=5849 RepID=A0A1J1GQ68_PLAGA|nr:histidine--tRNA ligase, putative [Plasmodium gallinaceum]CRG94647.1 histidine--tRNA ligase, putative [Plasmodium gallinaceum]